MQMKFVFYLGGFMFEIIRTYERLHAPDAIQACFVISFFFATTCRRKQESK
jgi:hypothetical protein